MPDKRKSTNWTASKSSAGAGGLTLNTLVSKKCRLLQFARMAASFASESATVSMRFTQRKAMADHGPRHQHNTGSVPCVPGTTDGPDTTGGGGSRWPTTTPRLRSRFPKNMEHMVRWNGGEVRVLFGLLLTLTSRRAAQHLGASSVGSQLFGRPFVRPPGTFETHQQYPRHLVGHHCVTASRYPNILGKLRRNHPHVLLGPFPNFEARHV